MLCLLQAYISNFSPNKDLDTKQINGNTRGYLGKYFSLYSILLH